MSDLHFLLFKSLILNAITIGFLFWALRRLDGGAVKRSFLFMLGAIFFFINSINLFQLPGLDAGTAALISKVIFASAIIMNGAFGHFLLTFCHPGERTHIRYWLFQANMIVLALLSFSDLLAAGVRPLGDGFAPVYGPLHKYAAVSIAIGDVYILTMVYLQYRRITDDVLQYQIQGLSWASLITFLAIITTNAFVPAFLGDSELSRASAFWPLFYFTGLLHIIVNGRTMFLTRSFRRLLKDSTRMSEDNLWSLRRLLHSVDQLLHEKPDAFQQRIPFTTQDNEVVEVSVSSGVEIAETEKIDLRQGMPQKWFRGLLENLYRLESDNKRLSFSLIRAEQELHSDWLARAIQGGPERGLLLQNGTPLADYERFIAENLDENRRTFGVEMLCFSESLFLCLETLRKYARSNQAVIFEGETGTGKTLLARALHHMREGGPLITLSCMHATSDQLRESIQEFIALPAEERPGFLLRHLDALPESEFRLLEPVLNEASEGHFVYFTALPDFLLHPPEMPGRLLYRLKQLSLSIPPLRDRPEDLFHQLLYFAGKENESCELGFQELHQKAMEQARSHTWPGNSRELKFTVDRALMAARPPVLENLQLEQPLALPGVKEGLTPLEDSERDVIVKYLKKNNFNKSQTRRDLGITINTLNSKMQRYGIQARKNQ